MTLEKLGFAIASSIFLYGCASKEPIKLHELRPTKYDSVGVLWSWNLYPHGFERGSYATVTKVDGVTIDTSAYGPPIELLPGRHVIEIRYDRDSFLCGYFGCMTFKQSTKSLELLVESGHSYKPFTRKLCNRDWFWIEDDLGISALDAITGWKERRYHISPLPFEARTTDGEKSKVAAGEEPPENCEDGQQQ